MHSKLAHLGSLCHSNTVSWFYRVKVVWVRAPSQCSLLSVLPEAASRSGSWTSTCAAPGAWRLDVARSPILVICSVPIMTGLQGREVFQSSTGWLPIESTVCPGLVVMSIGFLLTNPKEAVNSVTFFVFYSSRFIMNQVMWRGPKKNSMIKQFIDNVSWGDLDILIVDTPPGTSDEHLRFC